MAKLNYNRPNGGYEKEPWDKFRQDNQKKSQALNKTINQETVFIRGKFSGQDIGQLYKRNPKYFAWVLENNPTGIVAKQIINYFNRK
jgi:hypothetical protein